MKIKKIAMLGGEVIGDFYGMPCMDSAAPTALRWYTPGVNQVPENWPNEGVFPIGQPI